LGRILAIDYGKKRTGIAVTDPLQLIATALTTLDTDSLVYWLKQYCKDEQVDEVIVGYPLALDGSATDATPLVDKFLRNFKKVFPDMPLQTRDESYTSQQSVQAMIDMGMKQKDRRKKEHIDALSAVILLQEYLESRP
jgi:putative holliday junction resolvase